MKGYQDPYRNSSQRQRKGEVFSNRAIPLLWGDDTYDVHPKDGLFDLLVYSLEILRILLTAAKEAGKKTMVRYDICFIAALSLSEVSVR